MKKICIVAGARPNFIKVAPVIRAIVAARKSGREVDYQLEIGRASCRERV